MSKNKGFTLMEMIIVVAIISALMAIAAIGINNYVDSANKHERDNVAEVSYLGLQNYLTSLKRDGGLSQFNSLINADSARVKTLSIDSELKDILANHYDASVFDDEYANYTINHKDSTIVAVLFSGGDTSSPLYKVLFECLGNTDALDGAFVVEYNQTSGVVMSVFYSKTISDFDFATMYSGSLHAKSNIILRDSDSLDEKLQGYYGIYNTALKGTLVPYENEDAKGIDFVNSDRVYLTFTNDALVANKSANVIYQVTLYAAGEAGAPVKLTTIDYRASDLYAQTYDANQISAAIDHVDQVNIVSADEKRGVRLTSYTDQAGNYTDKYFLVLDCQHLYSHGAGLRYNLESGAYKDIIAPLNTPVEKLSISATLQVFVDGVATGELCGSEKSINPVFAAYDAQNDIYEISCTRHLNNIKDYPYDRKYLMTDDINLLRFEREEFYEAKVINEESGLADLNMSEADIIMLTGTLGQTSNRHVFNSFEQIKCYVDSAKTMQSLTSTIRIRYNYDSRSIATDALNGISCETIKTGRAADGTYHGLGGTSTLEAVTKSDTSWLFDGMIIGYKGADATFRGNMHTANEGAYAYIDSQLASLKSSDCYKITGISINNPSSNFVSILGCLGENGVFGAVALDHCAITGSDEVGLICGVNRGHINGIFASNITVNANTYVGGLIGKTEQSVSNLHITGDLKIVASGKSTSGTSYFQPCGGIVGSVVYDTLLTSAISIDSTDIVVSNCSIDSPSGLIESKKTKSIGGIVGECYGAIRDCQVQLVDIVGYSDTGGIAGKMFGGEITSCQVSVTHISDASTSMIGGVVGVAGDYSLVALLGPDKSCVTIKDCQVNNGTSITISSSSGSHSYIGGFVGLANELKVEDSVMAGTILLSSNYGDSYTYTGGFVGGSAAAVSISDVTFTGTIKCNTSFKISKFGGIIGGCVSKDAGFRDHSRVYNQVFENCVITGGILVGNQPTSIEYAGGVVGYILADSDSEIEHVTIKDCLLKDNASGHAFNTSGAMKCVGGIAGRIQAGHGDSTLNITSCGYDGALSAAQDMDAVGAIVGYANKQITIDSCPVTDVLIRQTNWAPIANIGGIAGNLTGSEIVIKDSPYTLVNVSGSFCKGSSITKLGGIVGNATANNGHVTITNCPAINVPINDKDYGNLEYVGGIAGYTTGDVTISDSKHTGAISSMQALTNSGGILGFVNSGSAVITNSPHEGNISSNNTRDVSDGSLTVTVTMFNVGGIVGKVNGRGTIKNSPVNNSAFSGGGYGLTKYVGGIAGYITSSTTIEDSPTNATTITGAAAIHYVGGIVGSTNGNNASVTTILRSPHTGAITANGTCNTNDGNVFVNVSVGYVGGIIGKAPATLIITDSSALNTPITAKGYAKFYYVGGICGQIINVGGQITNSPHSGDITINENASMVGGIVGYGNGPLVIGSSPATGNIVCTNYGSFTNVGGLIGMTNGSVTVTGSPAKADLKCQNGLSYVGGLIGNSNSSITITGSSSNGVIETMGQGARYVGGLLGYSKNGGTITDSGHTGSITFATNGEDVGGLVGYMKTGTMERSPVVANIRVTNDGELTNTGGLIGMAEGMLVIKASGTEGELSSNKAMTNVGGLVGAISASNVITIEDSSHKGNIIARTHLENVGGLVGKGAGNITITKSHTLATAIYNTGYDNAKNVGGMVGYAETGTVNIKDSNHEGDIYVNGEKSGTSLSSVGGIVGNVKNLKLTSVNSDGDIYSTKGALSEVGGLAGLANGSVGISDCEAKTQIYTGNYTINYAGGLVAHAKAAIEITDSYHYGDITGGKAISYAGGIAGCGDTSVTIKDCAHEGSIESSSGNLSDAGGIVGKNVCGFDIERCAAIGDISCVNGSCHDVGAIMGYGSTDTISAALTNTYLKGNYAIGNIYYKNVDNDCLGGMFGYISTHNGRAVTKISNNYFGGSIYHKSNVFDYLGREGGYIVGRVEDGTLFNSGGTVRFESCYAYSTDDLQTDIDKYIDARSTSVEFSSPTPSPHNDFVLSEAEYKRLVTALGGDPDMFTADAVLDIMYLMELTGGSKYVPSSLGIMTMSMPLDLYDDEDDLDAEETVSEDSVSGDLVSGDSVSGDSVSGDSVSEDSLPEDPVGDTPPADPVGDTPPADPVGDTPPADPVGDAPPADPVGDTPPADPVGDTPPADPVGDTPPEDPVGDTPPADPVGDTPPADPVGDTPPADPVGDTPPADPVGE